jgi:hypothetical protein
VARSALLRHVGRSWLQGRYAGRLISGTLPRRIVAYELAGALAGLAARSGTQPVPIIGVRNGLRTYLTL